MNIELTVDTRRIVHNSWTYENYGTADLLTVQGVTLTNLPASKSKTGSAFYQTARTKCFDIPVTYEIWIKFDVYVTNLSQRWRAYNDKGGSTNNKVDGICSQSDGTLSLFCYSESSIHQCTGAITKDTLQTYSLHMISGNPGLLRVDIEGSSYTEAHASRNINNGEPLNNIYLQSDGEGTFFSNVFITNGLRLEFDVKREVIFSVEFTVDVVKETGNNEYFASRANALKVWLPFDTSPTEDLYGNMWRTYGTPAIQDSELYLDGAKSYLKATSTITIELGTSPFTVCCWFSTTKSDANVLWRLGDYCVYISGGKLLWTDDQANLKGVTLQTNVADGEKHYLEVAFAIKKLSSARVANQVVFFLDGTQIARIDYSTSTYKVYYYTPYTANLTAYVGTSSGAVSFTGTLDEFQIYDGILLHTEDFTPPSAEYYAALLAALSSIPVNFLAETQRLIQNKVTATFLATRYVVTSTPWKYYSHGAADDLLICGTTVTDLPKTQSRTGTAYSQSLREKSFNIPPSNEIWLKFDFYNKGIVFAGNEQEYFIRCGIATLMSNLAFYGYEGNGLLGRYDVLKSDTLQTILLHLKAGTTDGIIEAWIDGEFVARHTGNVNGVVQGLFPATALDNISLQGARYSNIMVSNVQIGFEEGYCEITADLERVIKTHEIISIHCDTERRLPHKLTITPIDAPPEQIDTTGVQSISIDLAAQQLTDQLSFTWIHPAEIMEQIRGQYLDYKFDMRVKDITKIGVLRTCYCCSDIDELLYTQVQIGIKIPSVPMTTEEAEIWRALENAWYLEYFGVPKYLDDVDSEILSQIQTILSSAAKKFEVLAKIFGKCWVVQFEDFSSTVFFGRGVAYTFGDMIRELFGWTSRVPNLLINCYLRGDTLYAVQRGHEANVIDLTATKHTMPVVRENLMRLAWGSDADSYTITTTEPVYTPDEELEADNAAQNTPMTDEAITNKYDDDNLVTQTTIRDDETTTVIDYEYTTTASGRKLLVREITKVTDNDTGDTVEEREVIHEPLADSRSGQGLSVARDEDGETTASVVGQKPFTDKPTPWAKHVHMNGKWYTLTGEQEKEVTINGHALVDTSLPVTDFATKKKFSDAINWLNRKTQEVVSMDVYDFPHVIDFNDRIIFNGAVYFLESNTVTKTPRIVNKQSVRFVRWY